MQSSCALPDNVPKVQPRQTSVRKFLSFRATPEVNFSALSPVHNVLPSRCPSPNKSAPRDIIVARVSAKGNPIVVIGTPEGAAKMFRAEAKYSVRTAADKNLDRIFKPINRDAVSMAFVYIQSEEWKHLRSNLSKQIVPRRVANYAPGLCDIGDSFVEYIRHKRCPDGYVEDVHNANMKRAYEKSSVQSVVEVPEVHLDASVDVGLMQSGLTETKEHSPHVGLEAECFEGVPILKKKLEQTLSSGVDETKPLCMQSSNTATFLLHEVAKQPELQKKLSQEYPLC
eukprot:Em0003g1752a